MNGVLVPRRYQCSVLLGGPDLVIERAMSRKCYDVGAGSARMCELSNSLSPY